jgi:hypothetical protein
MMMMLAMAMAGSIVQVGCRLPNDGVLGRLNTILSFPEVLCERLVDGGG